MSIKYVAMVVDAPAGPPPVMIHGRSKSCNEPIIDKKIQMRIVGPSNGSVTIRVVCHGVAPSSAAASRNSPGMK